MNRSGERRNPGPGDGESETCGTCVNFTADPIGYGGIGTCALEVLRETAVLVIHDGISQFHYQKLLLYPGQVACRQWVRDRMPSMSDAPQAQAPVESPG